MRGKDRVGNRHHDSVTCGEPGDGMHRKAQTVLKSDGDGWKTPVLKVTSHAVRLNTRTRLVRMETGRL